VWERGGRAAPGRAQLPSSSASLTGGPHGSMVARCQLLRVDTDVCGGGGNGKTVSTARVDSFSLDPFLSPPATAIRSARLPVPRIPSPWPRRSSAPVPPPEQCAAVIHGYSTTVPCFLSPR
jgi:hypothetical protein